MNKTSKIAGLALAIGAASLITLAPVTASADAGMGKTHCAGVNACKGKSSCKTADNACKGKNSCKGKGVVNMSKEACEQVGGTASK